MHRLTEAPDQSGRNRSAVAYLRVVDPNESIVELQDALSATSQIAQTTLNRF
jgi:hypothetical protein